ncbi:MAG: hypothetical protein AAB824_00550 [Patescibacteria group bacterium]
MEIPKFEFFSKKAPKNSAGPDNVIAKKQYLQSTIDPADEHRRAEIAGRAQKGTKTTKDGDRIEALISEDGSILEYTNQTAVQKKIHQDELSQN